MKLETTQTVPLTMLDNGAIRITGTRVSLDSIIYGYKRGQSAEEIHDDFPPVSLAQVYGVIWYYLQHREEVEAYLREQEAHAEEVKRQIEAQPGYLEWCEEMRRRIQARWEERQKSLADPSN